MIARTLWAFLCFGALCCYAQDSTDRTLPVSVSSVQAALKRLPGGTSGALPVLDGFVAPGAHRLDQYQRPVYECHVHVTPSVTGGSLVHVTTKITAWNSDPRHPGYEVLKSNGRIEADLLDRLQTALGAVPATRSAAETTPPIADGSVSEHASASAPEISAPMPQFPGAYSAPRSAAATAPQDLALEQEAKGLEELLQNQSHPANLVAVKQDQTPLLQEPSAGSKVLFLVSAEDEFEILDSNPEWVHVRISGLSRGWLRRSSVDVLDGSQPGSAASPSQTHQETSTSRSSDKLYSLSGEEVGSFPGDWAPLKGKSVKIVSIQQAPGTGRITSPQDKLRFAENVFRSQADNKGADGLVLIFDTEDGGMIAATRATLDLWRTGALSDQGFWKQCYLDPPEILGSAN